MAELGKAGWGAFTIESVAARAGVARSTVYRHWPDKLTLLVDALEHHAPQRLPDEATPGRAQVVALVRHLAEVMADRQRSPVVPALIDASERDPTLRRLHRAFNDSRRRALVDALAVAGVADPELTATALAGAVLYHRVMGRRPLHPDRAEALVRAVIGPERATSRRAPLR